MPLSEEQLRAMIPELSLVESEAHLTAVIAIWLDLHEAGGHDDLRSFLFVPGSPVTLVEHVRAVTLAANALCDVITTCHRIDVDRDSIIVAALLHDAGGLVEHFPDGRLTLVGQLYPHTFPVVELARARGLPDKIINLILTHTPKIKQLSPYGIEAKILEHADMVSADVVLAVRDGRLAPDGNLTFRP